MDSFCVALAGMVLMSPNPSWQAVAMPGTGIRALVPAGEELVAGGDGGVSMSSDGARTWRPLGLHKPVRFLGASSAGEIWAAGDDGLFVGSNGDWKAVALPRPSKYSHPAVSALHVEPAGAVWIALFDEGATSHGHGSNRRYLFRSADRGRTFSERAVADDDIDITSIAVTAAGEPVFGSGAGVFLEQAGAWRKISDANCTALLLVQESFFVATPTSIRTSRTVGEPLRSVSNHYGWRENGESIVGEALGFSALAHAGVVYAASEEGGVFRVERGRLAGVFSGLPRRDGGGALPVVIALAALPDGSLFAALRGGGLFRLR